jgi:hypothetical protein
MPLVILQYLYSLQIKGDSHKKNPSSEVRLRLQLSAVEIPLYEHIVQSDENDAICVLNLLVLDGRCKKCS